MAPRIVDGRWVFFASFWMAGSRSLWCTLVVLGKAWQRGRLLATTDCLTVWWFGSSATGRLGQVKMAPASKQLICKEVQKRYIEKWKSGARGDSKCASAICDVHVPRVLFGVQLWMSYEEWGLQYKNGPMQARRPGSFSAFYVLAVSFRFLSKWAHNMNRDKWKRGLPDCLVPCLVLLHTICFLFMVPVGAVSVTVDSARIGGCEEVEWMQFSDGT